MYQSHFQRYERSIEVKSGFSGGFIKILHTGEVRTGRTGHAEVIQVSYDPEKISLHELFNYSYDDS